MDSLDMSVPFFFSPTYQNNYVSNNEECLVLDFRDHSHAQYGRYFSPAREKEDFVGKADLMR